MSLVFRHPAVVKIFFEGKSVATAVGQGCCRLTVCPYVCRLRNKTTKIRAAWIIQNIKTLHTFLYLQTTREIRRHRERVTNFHHSPLYEIILFLAIIHSHKFVMLCYDFPTPVSSYPLSKWNTHFKQSHSHKHLDSRTLIWCVLIALYFLSMCCAAK